MKARISIVVLAVLIASIAYTAPALAETRITYFPNGAFCISELTVRGVTSAPLASARMSSTNGWGGTAAASGWRDAWITTSFISSRGKLICKVRSGVHWEWSKGVITKHTRYTPRLTVLSYFPLTGINMTYKWGDQWAFTWNGNAKGGWYTSVSMHVEQTVFKYGVLGASDVLHEYKEQANGRYWWQATL